VIEKEFLELLKRLKNERLLSSEAENLFSAAKGNRYALKLNFIQFSSVLGRQLNSDYNSGYKFECITEEELDVLVLFQDEHKELVGSLSGQNSREINVQVLGYDSLYQKPILGYLEGEISQQQLQVEDDGQGEVKDKSETNAETNAEVKVKAEGGVEANNKVKDLLESGPNHREEDPKKLGAELKEGGAWESKRPINESVEDAILNRVQFKEDGDFPDEPKNTVGAVITGLFIIFVLVVLPVFLGSHTDDSERPKVSKELDEFDSKERFLLKWARNTKRAEQSFESDKLVAARQNITEYLYLAKKNGFKGDNGMAEVYTYRSYLLLGKIYDRLEDSYKACQNLLKANKTASNPYRYDRRELKNLIDKQFLKLKEQGMGDLIDEKKRALTSINQKWLESVIEIAADEEKIGVASDGYSIFFLKTKEPYSGWAKFFHDSGAIKELIHYDQGERHGHYRSWKIDGSVASIATYYKGKKTGLNPQFGDDGKAYNIPLYRNGKPITR
jgi:antitoxin component YwqK of YwqJK toxin-antitoxin module